MLSSSSIRSTISRLRDAAARSPGEGSAAHEVGDEQRQRIGQRHRAAVVGEG